jgi:hypothetical protein
MTHAEKTRPDVGLRSVPKRYFSETELSEYAGIATKTLRNWRLLGTGPVFCHFGSLVRYDLQAFDKWAESQRRGAEAT